ncbi:MAG TPA: 30S ribosomal protein S5 [Candidatus Saccharimonadales bacterium]|jgi:small subunit ribosomal protein S5
MADATTTQAPAANAAPQATQGGYNRGGQGGGRGGNDRRPRRPEMAPEEKQFDERTLHVDRVARVVKGGRRFRFRALVVVGDRKHKVGIGIAKGADVTAAVTKATDVAKKHMITVALYKGTLPHETEAKVAGAKIMLKPASAGTGLIAGGVVRTILEVAGVGNALSKSLGSTNKANTAYATIAALEQIVPASKWVTTSLEKKTASRAKMVSDAADKKEAK